MLVFWMGHVCWKFCGIKLHKADLWYIWSNYLERERACTLLENIFLQSNIEVNQNLLTLICVVKAAYILEMCISWKSLIVQKFINKRRLMSTFVHLMENIFHKPICKHDIKNMYTSLCVSCLINEWILEKLLWNFLNLKFHGWMKGSLMSHWHKKIRHANCQWRG